MAIVVPARRAASLIEVLVAMALAALLAALALVAVQQAREASRRAVCAARLHDLGIATAQSVEVRGGYPRLLLMGGNPFGPPMWVGAPWGELLPYLDPVVAGAVNDRPRDFDQWIADNITIAQHAPPALLCPSLASIPPPPGIPARFAPPASTSFAGNGGSFGVGDDQDGVFRSKHSAKRVHPRDLTDGLGRTALYSEWIPWAAAPKTRGPLAYSYDLAMVTRATLVPMCENAPSQARPLAAPLEYSKGQDWLGGLHAYAHTLPPGRWDVLEFHDNVPGTGLDVLSAGSFHAGVVNVCYGDGHVAAHGLSIAPAVWRSIGSRNDGGPTGDF